MSFLPVPRHDTARTASARSTASQRSVLQFKTVVKMLAPSIWSNMEKRKRDSPAKQENNLVSNNAEPTYNGTRDPDSNGRLIEPIRLDEQLDIQNLEELMYRFKTHLSNQNAIKTWKARRGSRVIVGSSHLTGLMTLDEFRSTLSDLLNVEAWDADKAAVFETEMEILFKKVDLASDGLVDWDEFCTYMMIQFKEHDETTKYGKSFSPKMNIIRIMHNKETTTRILKDFNPMRYVTVSKEGIIGVWSTELDLQRSIEIEERSPQDKASNKRHIKMWVTDAVTMNNVHKLVVATTNMDLYFYDMSTPIYTPQYHLCAIGNVPLCLNYHYNPKLQAGRSMLLFGTDSGCVNVLIFSNPVKGLFQTPFKKTSGSHKIFYQDICQHSHFVSLLSLGTIHSDWVRRVQYVAVKEFVISCSGSAKDSLVVRDIDEKKRKTYVFKVAKGIDCFDYNHDINVIATGGVDHAVRLWNPYVTTKPVAVMKSHQSSIVDLVIHQTLRQVFSFDKDANLKCWDIKEQMCIQSLVVRDPFNHRIPEHGPFPFCLTGSPVNSLLISCNDIFVEVKLMGLGTTKAIKTTHAKPLCSAVYNGKTRQVITACEGSVIVFWDFATGSKILQIPEAHGNEEISCLHFDSKESRVMTGARDGSIHVWNANNGHLLNKLAPLEEAEVTGIESFPGKKKILTVGWHRKIISYCDDRQDDILTSAYCPPHFLATASFDGDIVLWGLDREKMIRILKKGSRSLFKSKIVKIGLLGQRERRLSRLHAQQTAKKEYAPIDKLLFLTTRAQGKAQESATLISSQCGFLEFWCLYGAAKPMGRFYACDKDNAFVLAMATDPSNDVLLTGDSTGRIVLWDISSYCISRTESIIAQVWSTTQKFSGFDDSPEPSPPKSMSWCAHDAAIVSLEVVKYKQNMFILSASTDCTSRLWTFNGDYVGMFGQKMLWDIEDETTYQQRLQGPRNEAEKTGGSEGKTHRSSSPRDDVATESPKRDSIPMEICEDVTIRSSPSVLPKLQPSETQDSKQTNENQSLTSLVLDRKPSDSWSILGHKYNNDFQQRMQTRQIRRTFMGYVDRRLTSGGGMGSQCSPFQALHIPETTEFKISSDLPVTKRMLRKAAKLNTDQASNVGINHTLPVLPAIKRSESINTVNSINKESHQSYDQTSQVSFIAE